MVAAITEDELTVQERLLWESFPRGQQVDLRAGDPDQDDPAEGHRWGTERTIRAEVLTALLLGARDPEPGHVPAVRLFGAKIIGHFDVADGTVNAALTLRHCHIMDVPDFTGAQATRIRITDSWLPGFIGAGMRTEGHLGLSGCVIDGSVRLPGAHLAGGFRLNGTRISSPGGWALHAEALNVQGAVRARNLQVNGAFRLIGARLDVLLLQGACLTNPDRDALVADNMVIEAAMECSQGFTAEGTVRLRGTTVNGTLSFDRGALRSPTMALHASHMQIQELILTPRTKIEGEVRLSYTNVGVILDNPATWPEQLKLNGLVYESLRGRENRLEHRLTWVTRDPEGYRPQPYGQLAEWYRKIGQDDHARRVLLAKQRHRRREMRLVSRIPGYLLDATVGYGYRPQRAGLWLVVLLALGSVVFAVRPPVHIGDGVPPPFNSVVYTLDLLVPFGAFGLRDVYAAAGATQWFAYGLIASGWILATALIAAVTRVLYRT